MTALVTGAGGFLGTALVERLLARGDERLRLFVRPGGKRQELEALARRHGAEVDFVVGSLTDPGDCAGAVAGVDTVYHLAAGTRGPAEERFLNSVTASERLLDAAVAEGGPVKMVLVSSFSVYGVATLGRGALVDERTPLEPHPERRDVYAQAKLQQERLFWEYRERHGLPLVVLRPGVIYGPGARGISERVGLRAFGLFLQLGGDNQLPLNYVDNCAEAIVVAAGHPGAVGEAYNTVDDDLPSCAEYLRAYRRSVEPLRAVRVPYRAAAALRPYRAAAMWGGNRFSNEKIKGIGYREVASTQEGMRRAFETP